MLLEHAIVLLLGFVLDLLFGDPRWLYHPVCLIGNLISFMGQHIRPRFPQTQRGEHQAGLLLVLVVCLFTLLAPGIILFLCYRISRLLGIVLETFWCYQLLATRDLRDEAMEVCKRLREGDLDGARHAVSMIVGRDTESLDEAAVTRATVETIAENTSDGVIAPMFFMAIGGIPLMYLYKGINTMDSMVGYKDEKYLHYGRYAAKLDDIVNFIPARISAVFMIVGAAVGGLHAQGALRIFRRDRKNHASPNSAQTESVMAGALGVQLAGDASYFGKQYRKKTIGDPDRPIETEDIARAARLLYISCAICCAVFAVILVAGSMIL